MSTNISVRLKAASVGLREVINQFTDRKHVVAMSHAQTHTHPAWLHKYILCTCDFKRVWTDAGHCDVSLTTECGIRLRLLCTTCTVYIQCSSVMLLHTCLLMNINTFFFVNITDFWVDIQLKFLRTKSAQRWWKCTTPTVKLCSKTSLPWVDYANSTWNSLCS